MQITPQIMSHTGRYCLTMAREIYTNLLMGATCHISPERSDFQTLMPIPPHPIKGLSGVCVYTVGLGTIELSVALGRSITLHKVLFALASTVHLISVLTLNWDGNCVSHFDSTSCWVMDKATSMLVAKGTISPTRNLYTISAFTPNVVYGPHHPRIASTSFYATRVPDLETWHYRLGHCNTRTIINMAQNNIVKGMPIDLSTMPPKCDSCILGKQARTPVLKMCEGVRATRCLERVFVDLCGPMSIASKTGRLYAMNIIDDYSSYVWTIPLRSKDEASRALQVWHLAITNHCDDRLKILVTDNGELQSHSVADWCAGLGIEHQFTAPYTSAHNGCAERLHQTLLNKARTMCLVCNTPASLWDEFYATAVYLTNLTASSSLDGKTPFKFWFGHSPSLSHLREIGCKVFALIMTHNPKLLQWSVPCVLISYAPHAKAHRLWNLASGRVCNSFHVTFVEHLDTMLADLLPSRVLNIDDHSIPPSWEAVTSGIASPTFTSPSTISPFVAPPSPQVPIAQPYRRSSRLKQCTFVVRCLCSSLLATV